VRAHNLGETFVSPLDVKLEPGLVMQPDVLVVPVGEVRRRSDVVGHLLLAVEVLSPSSARFDRVTKRPAYQRNRVPEYWIVDGWSRTVERWHPDDERPEIVSDMIVWHPAGATVPFTLDLPEFFDQVLPEDA
jgi:Uma2 family endonuclease